MFDDHKEKTPYSGSKRSQNHAAPGPLVAERASLDTPKGPIRAVPQNERQYTGGECRDEKDPEYSVQYAIVSERRMTDGKENRQICEGEYAEDQASGSGSALPGNFLGYTWPDFTACGQERIWRPREALLDGRSAESARRFSLGDLFAAACTNHATSELSTSA
jgi:hypothetical protein